MRIFLKLISIIILVAVIWIAVLNSQISFNLLLWGTKDLDAVMHETSLPVVIGVIFFAGILAGVFVEASFCLPVYAKLKEYQRKLEKTSVQSSEDTSKVAVLEAKIKTLEKALQSALEKND